MAGLGETCSHVASLLWLIAVGVERRDSLSVTQKTAYWVMPPAIQSVPYLRIKEIEFIGKKKKHASSTTSGSLHCHPSSVVDLEVHRKLDPPSFEEKKKFLDSLASMKSGAKQAVLSVMTGYCDKYIPRASSLNLPPLLTDLYNPSNLALGYFELLELSSKAVINITDEQRQVVEVNTRDQSKSMLWFNVRAGRITASKFKAACHTDPACPSLSLIIGICHPDRIRFKTAATLWGCQHEKDALKQYESASTHHGLVVSQAGFFISDTHPFLGASPDSKVCCSCCGPGICEVKVSMFGLSMHDLNFSSVLIVTKMTQWMMLPMMLNSVYKRVPMVS
jgi:hypothetical protein